MGLTKPSSVEPDAIGRELMERIDAHLPIELRQWYLQMLAGVPVAADRKRRVREAVATVLARDDLLEEDEGVGAAVAGPGAGRPAENAVVA
ncbi:hypothetical protein J0H58_00905 [bacterium]|nr:hypothetical protein [bacterium]